VPTPVRSRRHPVPAGRRAQLLTAVRATKRQGFRLAFSKFGAGSIADRDAGSVLCHECRVRGDKRRASFLPRLEPVRAKRVRPLPWRRMLACSKPLSLLGIAGWKNFSQTLPSTRANAKSTENKYAYQHVRWFDRR